MPKKPSRTGITPAILLDHMQGMERRLTQTMSEVRFNLSELDKKTSHRFDRLERKVDFLSLQIGNIDERLDDIEVKQIPALKKAVGMR